MPPELLRKSRRLSAQEKERRRCERRAEQDAVDHERTRLVAQMQDLTRSFAPSEHVVWARVSLTSGEHDWSIHLCFGKGQNFDNIGRWYRMVSMTSLT